MPPQPMSPYAVSKLAGEHYCRVFFLNYGLETVALRYFNVFGPRQDPESDYAAVVPKFVTLLLDKKRPFVYGDGKQTRSFCFVSDLVEGLVRLLNSDSTGPVNCGNPTETTILQFAQKIIELTNSKSEIVFRPLPEDDPKVRQPDITLARKLLGWEPKVGLEEGLRFTIDYFRGKVLP